MQIKIILTLLFQIYYDEQVREKIVNGSRWIAASASKNIAGVQKRQNIVRHIDQK